MSKRMRFSKILLLFLLFGFFVPFGNGRADSPYDPPYPPEDLPTGEEYREKIGPNQEKEYEFPNNTKFGIKTKASVFLSVEYGPNMQNRQVFMNINNEHPLKLNISAKSNMTQFGYDKMPQIPEYERDKTKQLNFTYNTIYQLLTNNSIKNILFKFKISKEFGLNPDKNYTIAVYNENLESWNLLATERSDAKSPQSSLAISDSSDFYYTNQASEEFLIANLFNIQSDSEYFLTIFEVQNVSEPSDDWIPISLIMGILFIILITLSIVISKSEYFDMLKKRITPVDKGPHRLTMEEVLENENRNKIIELILDNPGIHFNQLLRKTDLAPGNLVWHLDILETYKVIGKKRVGNYVAYFPYYQKNPISNIDLKLQKSELTLQVLEMIEEKPGIYNKIITDKLEINRKTIDYHIKKLMDLGLINRKKDGRKKKLYPNLEADYYNN
jgi:predicted transcriptional regulator